MTDNQDITTKSTPESERRKLGLGDIWSNSIQCKKCGEIIRSRHQHDLVSCSCLSASIDGGTLRPRIIGKMHNINILYECYDDAD